MKRLFLIPGAALLLLSAVGYASPPSAQSTPAQAAVGDDDSKVICKNTLQTGSRFSERKCHTKAEWDQISEAARKGAHETFDRQGFFDQRSGGRSCC